MSPGTVSKRNKRIYGHIEKWRTRTIEGSYAYVYLGGVVLKRSWGGEVRNISVLVAIGVDQDGYRSILGVAEGVKEDKAGRGSFLKYLKQRGLTGVRLIISDACLGLVESIGEFYPQAQRQRCTVHFYRNVFIQVPRGKVAEVSRMLKAIHAQEDLAAARDKAQAVVEKLRGMKLRSATDLVEKVVEQTLTYYHFPIEHWRRIRTNNPMERIIRAIPRRTRVVGAFPDGESALMLVAARLRHVASAKWGTRKHLNMDLLNHGDYREALAG